MHHILDYGDPVDPSPSATIWWLVPVIWIGLILIFLSPLLLFIFLTWRERVRERMGLSNYVMIRGVRVRRKNILMAALAFGMHNAAHTFTANNAAKVDPNAEYYKAVLDYDKFRNIPKQ